MAEICKVQKGKKTFYARVEMEWDKGKYMGYQCYKDTGDFIYSKWSSLKTLNFIENEIIERFNIDDAESL